MPATSPSRSSFADGQALTRRFSAQTLFELLKCHRCHRRCTRSARPGCWSQMQDVLSHLNKYPTKHFFILEQVIGVCFSFHRQFLSFPAHFIQAHIWLALGGRGLPRPTEVSTASIAIKHSEKWLLSFTGKQFSARALNLGMCKAVWGNLAYGSSGALGPQMHVSFKKNTWTSKRKYLV